MTIIKKKQFKLVFNADQQCFKDDPAVEIARVLNDIANDMEVSGDVSGEIESGKLGIVGKYGIEEE